MKPTAVIAALVLALATPAVAQPLARPTLSEPPDRDFRSPPAIACPDQQMIDEVTAMHRLGDREGEWLTGRSYGCGPIVLPPPFER